jgi:hypothetical protein
MTPHRRPTTGTSRPGIVFRCDAPPRRTGDCSRKTWAVIGSHEASRIMSCPGSRPLAAPGRPGQWRSGCNRSGASPSPWDEKDGGASMIGHRVGRRGLLACLGFLGVSGRATAAILTPEQTAGPFYPPPNQRPQDTDWDLVKIEGRVREAGGEIMHLSGRVLDRGGAASADTLVEIWQCDANGRYPTLATVPRHGRSMRTSRGSAPFVPMPRAGTDSGRSSRFPIRGGHRTSMRVSRHRTGAS